MDDSEDIHESFGLADTILESRNENFNYIISKTHVNLHMIRFEDKTVFTITHLVPICVAVTIWLLESCIIETLYAIEFKEKQSIDKCRILFNYDTRDLVPTL